MLGKIFKKARTVGIVGNANTGKTMLCLGELLNLKEKYKIEIYCIGIEEKLHSHLKARGFKIIHSKEDILDLKIKDSVIKIDELVN